MALYLFLLLCVTVVCVILTSSRWPFPPLLVLVAAAFAFGIAADMSPAYVIRSFSSGFTGALDGSGLALVAGALIAAFLDRSGGGVRLARWALGATDRAVVRSRLPLVAALAGFAGGIAAVAESAFAVLAPLGRALSRHARAAEPAGTVPMALAMLASHTMVLPAMGPVIAAAVLSADLGRVLVVGLMVALAAGTAGWLFARRIAVSAGAINGEPVAPDDPLANEGKEGVRGWLAVLPMVVPLLLLIATAVSHVPTQPFGLGAPPEVMSVIGRGAVLLLVVTGLTCILLRPRRRPGPNDAGWMAAAIARAAVLVLVVGAGGGFARVLQNSGVSDLAAETVAGASLGLAVPFAIAAAIKTAQGSSLVAMITAAGLTEPLLQSLGLADPGSRALSVVAIGAGAMVVCHVNDTFFWVVTQVSGMTAAEGCRWLAVGSLIQGAAALGLLLILHALAF